MAARIEIETNAILVSQGHEDPWSAPYGAWCTARREAERRVRARLAR